MAVTIESITEHVAHGHRANGEELVGRIARAVRADGAIAPLPGVHLIRISQTNETAHSIAEPAFCVIAQGSKEVTVGERRYRYDPEHYLLMTVELPFSARIIEASTDRPYLGVRLDLDPAVVGSVMVEAGIPAPRTQVDA